MLGLKVWNIYFNAIHLRIICSLYREKHFLKACRITRPRLENSHEFSVALTDENAVLFRKKTMLKPYLSDYRCSSQTTKWGWI